MDIAPIRRLLAPFLTLRAHCVGLSCLRLWGGQGKTRQNAAGRAFAPSGQGCPPTPGKGSANPLPIPAKAQSEK